MSLKEITNSLRRRLSPDLRRKCRVGYLNSELERTKSGVHMFLNFLEEKFDKEFTAFIKERFAEFKAEESEDYDPDSDL